MSELPTCVESGERARLFPILAERSIEGRTLSIFLATLISVRPFAERLLEQMGRKIGPLAKLHAWTEVRFAHLDDDGHDRPDGLLIVDTGRAKWTALVEAKVRKSDIQAEQLARYLKIAKANKLDAVITLSNQFSLAPHHHPLSVSKPKHVELFHLSWMRVLTEAYLLLNEGIDDGDQEYILNEFKRFISHPSAGVESFTQMPPVWGDVTDTVQTGGSILIKPGKEVVQAWHQECQDLSLIFSRQIDAGVTQKLTRAQRADPSVRIDQDFEELRSAQKLSVELEVPDAADTVKVCADFTRRTVSVWMYVNAPGDKKRNSARLNWLLRQLPHEDEDGIHIRAQWPGTSPWTQISLSDARSNGDDLFAEKGDMTLLGFEVVSVVDLGHRFGQRQTFIKELEDAVPDFWERAGQNLRAWVKPAPKVKQERSEPETVSPTAISDSD
ncbi:hypothetical protein NAP1_14523 [Erythrobacter sp. NAP1]|uniref:hypothetical protein n=1 Tax=Erythrobacter sp. NAP1 TaxID=237727 RepID=UPI00006878CD|nr:hypothetical protein [Erythrobacter sp. NAP1]EAQ28822.1 hypothetical protein NAP1_14523 [Erythrobacter sp. NAP1]